MILDPPVSGRFLPLWGLPVLILITGAFAIARRRRGRLEADEQVDPRSVAMPDQLRQQARRDIEELAVQVELGEVDADTAERLRLRYEAELERAEEASAEEETEGAASRSKARVITGWTIGLLAVGVVVVMVTQTVQERSEEDSLQAATGETDLSDVSNAEMEAVVAENPDVVPMRIALADRYFEAGDFEASLDHYLEVLKRDRSQAGAWARLGWSVYQLGDADLAEEYLQRSLDVEPGLPEAQLYLGLVYLYGFSDPESALPLLNDIAARDNVPPDIRQVVEAALVDAKKALGEG